MYLIFVVWAHRLFSAFNFYALIKWTELNAEDFSSFFFSSIVGLFSILFLLIFYFCWSKLITASAWHVPLLDFFFLFMFNYPFYVGDGLFIYSNIYLERLMFSSSLVLPVIFAPLLLCIFFIRVCLYRVECEREGERKRTLNGNFLKRITNWEI